MGDGAILFDENTWKTSILNPAAAVIYEALIDEYGGRPIAIADAIHLIDTALGLDPDSQNTRELLSTLQRLGLVA